MANGLVLAEPQAAVETGSEIEKAWYILTLLLRTGRPAMPAEIVSRFRLVPASAEFLEFLCRIPNSPLFLTDGGFLTISEGVAVAFRGFAILGTVPEFVPRFTAGFAGLRKVWDVGDVLLRYSSRKRKGCGLLPMAKRRSLVCRANEELEADEGTSHLLTLQKAGDCVSGFEVQATVPDTVSGNNLSMNVAVMEYASGTVKEGKPLTLSLLTYDTALSHSDEITCDEGRCIDVNICPRLRYPLAILDTEIKLETRALLITNDDNRTTTAAQVIVLHETNSMDPVFLEEHKKQDDVESGYHQNSTSRPLVNDFGDNCGQGKAEKDLVKFDAFGDALNISIPLASKMEAVATLPSSEPLNAEKWRETLFDKPVDRIPSSAGLVDGSGTETDNRSKKKQTEDQEDNKFALKKLKRSQNNKMAKKENKSIPSKFPKNHVESKFPEFESYILEEEEGSGGYGTVYRARRKNDGKTFAIKCPHPNAHPYHVNNELRMLKRFGGRSFIIKYEGSFKSGKSECFILEHVEHDRPEILKKEIGVSELRWYGFCMFRALSSLHKQGIVHRDIKPGNFLFSCKLNKGYLIDFNLALDLKNRCRPSGKSYANSHRSSDQVSYQYTKVISSTKARKSSTGRNLEVYSKEPAKKAEKGPGKTPLSKYINKAASKCPDSFSDFDCRNKYGIQVADGSGITSAKDITSTRTPSADRLREPIPCCGRRELINLVQEVMQSPSQNSFTIPASQRKRIAAPHGKVERQLAFLTPMPLLSNGISVSAPERKYKNEGPCVGTKGFRAPEVLLKSIHQSCKVDIWSAGVTLLYLMIGRTPFGGDPDQNIKEIAKLRGSEDLWEVAKLHNCESSFPMELYDIQSLETTKLSDWCKKNTKRPDFLDQIPSLLFDLVDKCLTVNPRLRISADDALMHDFFSPCRDSLRKQRMLRQNVGSEAGNQCQ